MKYFIEHKETGLWWFSDDDKTKPKFVSSFNGSRIRMPGWEQKDGWTNDPNDPRIAFSSRESAEWAMYSQIHCFTDAVEVTEHEFV